MPLWLVALAVLAVGAVVGLLARLLLGSRVSLSAPTVVLAGIVGSALGGSIASAVAPPRHVAGVVITVVAALAGTVAVLVAVEALARRRRVPERPVRDLIAGGESAWVEFKSSARFNRHTGTRDERLEQVVAKTVCGFLNGRGGYLLIGVADDGTVAGLAADFALVKSADRDRYELWLRDMLSGALGTPAAALVSVSFAEVDGCDVATLRMPPSPRPVFLTVARGGGRNRAMMVRVGNSTRELAVDEALDYATRRWRPAAMRLPA